MLVYFLQYPPPIPFSLPALFVLNKNQFLTHIEYCLFKKTGQKGKKILSWPNFKKYLMAIEKEFYLYTHQELIERLGPELAKEKADWYKTTFLVMYPKTLCVLNGPLMNTYQQEQR
jgi:hypothetical protein